MHLVTVLQMQPLMHLDHTCCFIFTICGLLFLICEEKTSLKAFKLLAVLLGSRWRGYYSGVMLNPTNQTVCMSFRLRRTYWRVQCTGGQCYIEVVDCFLLFPSGSVINLHGGFMRCRASAFSVFTLFFPLHRSIRVVPAVSPANKQTGFFFFFFSL